MSELKIPAGLSLRQVAERLGVPVDELQKHAKGMDVEAPSQVERRIEVPDGFLRVVDRNRRAQYAAVPKTSARHRGANEVVTLDIEYRRTRIAGGLQQGKATASELDGIAEADHTFGRLEADSNDLAISLYQQLTRSQGVALRARAYARQSLAEARRYLLYGEERPGPRVRAMSLAKAALMADPKLAEAHLALAHALEGSAGATDLVEARVCYDQAVALGMEEVGPWAARVRRQLLDGALEAARDSAARALSLAPNDPLAQEADAIVAYTEGDLAACRAALERAAAACPTYANPHARLAHLSRKAGDNAARDLALGLARERGATQTHLFFLEQLAEHFSI